MRRRIIHFPFSIFHLDVGDGWVAENASGLLSGHVCEDSLVGSGNVAEGLEATLHVLKFSFSTPSGNPAAPPQENADRNEFTYIDDPPSLELPLRVKVSPTLPEGVALNGSFSLPGIEGSTLRWAEDNPGGVATSVTYEGFGGGRASDFSANATYLGYPTHNSGFGRKTVTFTCGGDTIAQDFEVFFPKFGTHHSTCATCPNCPNWFYYWREGGVCSISSDVRWAPVTGEHENTLGWFDGSDIFITDLAAKGNGYTNVELSAAMQITNLLFEVVKVPYTIGDESVLINPQSHGDAGFRYYVTNRVVGVIRTNETIRMNIDGAGIRLVAAIVVHEQCHRTIAQDRQIHAAQEVSIDTLIGSMENYGADSKEYAESFKNYSESLYAHGDREEYGGDLVIDSAERNGYLSLYTDPCKKDTFDIAGRYNSTYRNYGDNEARCRNAEWDHLEDKYHVELDWCNPGCQHKNVYGPFPEEVSR